MAEFMQITETGESYEDAIQKAMERLISICGNPTARIFRRDPDTDAAPYIDWVLDSTESCISPGGTTVGVVAVFFLFGSDE
jgi:hypothetical protein